MRRPFLATGADRPGDAVTSLGLTLVLKLLSRKPLIAPAYGLYSHRIGDLWLAGGASNSGGSVLPQFFSSDRLAGLEAGLTARRPMRLDYCPLPAPAERFPIADPTCHHGSPPMTRFLARTAGGHCRHRSVGSRTRGVR
jgi:D-ribulokinase